MENEFNSQIWSGNKGHPMLNPSGTFYDLWELYPGRLAPQMLSINMEYAGISMFHKTDLMNSRYGFKNTDRGGGGY